MPTWTNAHSEPEDKLNHVSSWVKFELAVEDARQRGFNLIASYMRRGTAAKVFLTGNEKAIQSQLKNETELKRFYIPGSVRWLKLK
jgi:regulator of extracellular matrix RemA (YlzA/DUF370 family)